MDMIKDLERRLALRHKIVRAYGAYKMSPSLFEQGVRELVNTGMDDTHARDYLTANIPQKAAASR